ncbi:MAG: RHS repeat-associated core domain-containing protein, partial [Xanthomonadales bacterium]|nr:RHS repeat-associated core domain-containing protein [Xanthomonadales bacterium]
YSYGAGNEKLTRKNIENGEEVLTWYVGNVEIITKDWENGVPGSIKSKRYVSDAVITHYGPEIIDVEFLHKDHLGSTQVVSRHNEVYTGYTGVYHVSYDAFGKVRGNTSPQYKTSSLPITSVTNKGFTGQDHISEMGLINFNARLYDSTLGMMLQADTIVPDGPVVDSLNRYAYVYNNPLSYTDPTGHAPDNAWDPWIDLRRAAERRNEARQKFNEFMGDMGYGNLSHSRFTRTSSNNGQNERNDLPAGVSQGGFENGDVAGGFSKKSSNDVELVGSGPGGKSDKATIPANISVEKDGFKTMADVAKYITSKYGNDVVTNRQELQTAIVKIGKNNYGYLTPGWGPVDAKIVDVGDLYDAYKNTGFSIMSWMHGHFDNQLNFSAQDFASAWHPDTKVVRRKTFLVNRKLETKVLNNLHLHRAMKKLRRSRKGNVGFSDLQIYYKKKGLPGDKL